MTPPTARACCCGRTCRCSGVTPGPCVSRPSARPERRSTCSATIPAWPCGAATTSRCRWTSSPARPTSPARPASWPCSSCPASTSPCWTDRSSARWRSPIPPDRWCRTRGCCPTPAKWAPTPTSTSAGTTARSGTSPPSAPASPAWPGSSPSSAPRPSPTRTISWMRTTGPISTGTAWVTPTPCRSRCSTAGCRRPTIRPSRPGGQRPSSTRPSSSVTTSRHCGG